MSALTQTMTEYAQAIRGDWSDFDGRSERDLDRMGICTRCGHGITARELLDGDEQCTTNNESEDEK